MNHACREADASKIDVDEILKTIAPPREWIEEGKLYRQYVSPNPLKFNAIMNKAIQSFPS